jgi:choice-of-anchor B domain-containing protein
MSSREHHNRTKTPHIIWASILLLGLAFTGKAVAQGVPCIAGFAGPYPCQNVDLLAFVPTSTLVGGSSGADIWGWTDPETGREYAVQSLSNSVAFVDVTEPTEPVFVGHLPAPVTNFLWRDVKVYRNHAYIVGDFSPFSADDDNPDAVHGLQIFDLTRLRGAEAFTEFTEDSRYLGFDEAHNFVVNEDSGFAYAVASDTCDGGMHMLDLEPDPANPRFVGCFDNGDFNVHDAQCVVYRGPDAEHRGREICFNANEDVLDIVDITDKQAPEVLARVTYEGQGYVHQGWLTEDHAHFALGDELDELNALTDLEPHNTHTYLFDVSDLDDPVQLPTHVGPTAAIDHNLYIRGRFMYQANYTAGLRILDASGIAAGELEEIAFFDTHPTNSETTFAGAWGNYPFFDSGVVVVGNIEDGLYVLGPHLPAEGGETGDKATGGGWMAAGSGRIQFAFEAEQRDDGPAGQLKLKDKGAGTRIRMTEITTIGPVQGQCGGIAPSDRALEFRGTGTFNGDTDASFRACVEDNGEPGHSRASDTPDRFYLECLAGCAYTTADRAEDAGIDAGNIGVRRGEPSGSADGKAVTLILDPALLDAAEAGTLQTFEVRAFGPDERPATGAEITLVQNAGGITETLVAVSGETGIASFTTVVPDDPAEYHAVSDAVESNAVSVEPLLH